jgi:hypothetical protein
VIDKKPSWTVVKEFEESGVLVEVSASDTARSRYSIRIGRRGERGAMPFLPLYLQGQGSVRVVSVAQTIEKLVRLAEDFVREEAQKKEDEYIEQRIARETRQVEREGKKKRGGYKQAGARQ